MSEMKCPKCGDIIDYLNFSAEKKVCWGGLVSLTDNEVDYNPSHEESDLGDICEGEYYCPECDEILYSNNDIEEYKEDKGLTKYMQSIKVKE